MVKGVELEDTRDASWRRVVLLYNNWSDSYLGSMSGLATRLSVSRDLSELWAFTSLTTLIITPCSDLSQLLYSRRISVEPRREKVGVEVFYSGPYSSIQFECPYQDAETTICIMCRYNF